MTLGEKSAVSMIEAARRCASRVLSCRRVLTRSHLPHPCSAAAAQRQAAGRRRATARCRPSSPSSSPLAPAPEAEGRLRVRHRPCARDDHHRGAGGVYCRVPPRCNVSGRVVGLACTQSTGGRPGRHALSMRAGRAAALAEHAGGQPPCIGTVAFDRCGCLRTLGFASLATRYEIGM